MSRQPSVLLFDGAYGTLFAARTGLPASSADEAVLSMPEEIADIHTDYMNAGARAIKTCSFSLPALYSQNPKQALLLASQSAKLALRAVDAFSSDHGLEGSEAIQVFADLGPCQPDQNPKEIYPAFFDAFLKEGITHFLLETLPGIEGIDACAKALKECCPDAYLIVSCAIGADGLSACGRSGRELLGELDASPWIDAIGQNCMIGPAHMLRQLEDLPQLSKPLSFMPNAGYPQVTTRRAIYSGEPEYFASRMAAMVHEGAAILGGCCGTSPDHIRALRKLLDQSDLLSCSPAPENEPDPKAASGKVRSRQPDRLDRNRAEGRLSILVELDPPASDNVSAFLEHASRLKRAGCDLLTIADNPIGRPRADSCLLACKVHRDLGMDVLPHMTCRDRNLNAIKALLLGLSMEDVHQVLLVTGDPIPLENRQEVRAVFSFNSRTLAAFVRTLENDGVCQPFHTFGALDLNARNFEIQLSLAQKKEEAGIEGFLTQPVFSRRALENLKKARQVLSGAIYGGIMPLVSYRNAMFLKNEIAGMDIPDELAVMYANKNREECEAVSLEFCEHLAKEMRPYVDGFYLMTPFQRVFLIEELIRRIRMPEEA